MSTPPINKDWYQKTKKFRCPSCHKDTICYFFLMHATFLYCRNPTCPGQGGVDYYRWKTTHHTDPRFLIDIEAGSWYYHDIRNLDTPPIIIPEDPTKPKVLSLEESMEAAMNKHLNPP